MKPLTLNLGDAPKVIPKHGAWLVGRWGWSLSEKPGNGTGFSGTVVILITDLLWWDR